MPEEQNINSATRSMGNAFIEPGEIRGFPFWDCTGLEMASSGRLAERRVRHERYRGLRKSDPFQAREPRRADASIMAALSLQDSQGPL
jgi:hypothetical protein